MNNSLKKLAELLADSGIEIKYDEPMSRHTTFRIGGSAAFYLIPHTSEELSLVLRSTEAVGCKTFILGNGSNVIFPDEGYDGAVISTEAFNKIEVTDNCIRCGAGAFLTLAAKAAKDHSLTGLEFAHGIPGSVGGAVYMNAGAYGGEIKDVLIESTYVTSDGVFTLTADEHRFGYRESVYKETAAIGEKRIITEAVFRLQKGDKTAISETMADFMNRRVTKQPLEYPSAGSVFKRYPGRFTGQMIEEAGLKGYTIGGAQVSEKHAGFIINIGGATANDVKKLVEYIKEVILRQFGCELECEIIFADEL